jgi:hypothetical protein
MALGTLTLLACSGDPSPVQAGDGPAGHLVSPNGAEGAVVLEFAGAVDTVAVAGGTAWVRFAGGVTRAALVLDKAGSIRFSLPHAPLGDGPAATVLEVADGSNQLRASTAGYRVDYDR